MKALSMTFEALYEKAKSLGLQVSCVKTKVVRFKGLLYETVQFKYACGMGIEILRNFIYVCGRFHQEILQKIALAQGVVDSLSTSTWYCAERQRSQLCRCFSYSLTPRLWDMGTELWFEEENWCLWWYLHRIIYCCWNDSQISDCFCLHSLWMLTLSIRACTQYSEVEPAHRSVPVTDSPNWRRPRCPLSLWLEQVGRTCCQVLGMGGWPAHRLAWRNPSLAS